MFSTLKAHARIYDMFNFGSLAKIKTYVENEFDGVEMKFRKLPYDGRHRYIFWFVDDDGVKNYLS